MAQEVAYFENNVTFTEGPFVIVECSGYRIEVEYKGAKCPGLPQSEIYGLIKAKFGLLPGKYPRKQMVKVCDWLNAEVKKGNIELVGVTWFPKRYLDAV